MDNKKINIKNKLDEGLTFKISRFKEVIKKTKPHKHDEYYELIYLSDGEGFHSIESDKFVVSPPEIYFLKPSQLHYWQFTSIPKGFVILFKESEFDPLKENIIIELYTKLFNIERLKLPSGKSPETFLNEILTEFKETTRYSKEIIHGLLKALFGRLLQYTIKNLEAQGLPLTIYDRFQKILTKDCPQFHKVNEFARLLNITPQNLNSICRKQTGKSASEIITGQIILEAKRYILHTDNTMNEIADILSFTDTSNFVKFFKRNEGITPFRFREKHFQ